MDTLDPNILAFTVADAAARAGLSRSTLYNAMAGGDLKARKLGSRTIILRTDLERWLNGMPAYSDATKYAPPANLTA